MPDSSSFTQPDPRKAAIPLVLQELRHLTSANHQGLEARLPFNSAQLDRRLYQRLIEAYYGFYVALEQRLDECGVLAPQDGRDRHKAPALARDLLAMGLTPAAIADLPLCEDLPVINNPAQRLGVLYVIEGATLGGQVLRRIMREKLSIDESNGGLFLDVYGQATGPMWKAFLLQLAMVVEAPQRILVTDAALSTFRCFERWLEQSGVLDR